jgi:hypothetical protein
MADITIIPDHNRPWGSIFQYYIHQKRMKVQSKGEMFWEALSTIITGIFPMKIIPMDDIFIYYRFVPH